MLQLRIIFIPISLPIIFSINRLVNRKKENSEIYPVSFPRDQGDIFYPTNSPKRFFIMYGKEKHNILTFTKHKNLMYTEEITIF